jgi:dTDP-4-dehydrorhamnose 3,5-epimerase-like enzyme
MKTINTKFKGLKILRHTSFKDERGFLRITHNQNKLKKKFIFVGSGKWDRTTDLGLMSPAL